MVIRTGIQSLSYSQLLRASTGNSVICPVSLSYHLPLLSDFKKNPEYQWNNFSVILQRHIWQNYCFFILHKPPMDYQHLAPIAELYSVIWRMAFISPIWFSTFFCQRNQQLQRSSTIIKRSMRRELLSDTKLKASISGFVKTPETISHG